MPEAAARNDRQAASTRCSNCMRPRSISTSSHTRTVCRVSGTASLHRRRRRWTRRRRGETDWLRAVSMGREPVISCRRKPGPPHRRHPAPALHRVDAGHRARCAGQRRPARRRSAAAAQLVREPGLPGLSGGRSSGGGQVLPTAALERCADPRGARAGGRTGGRRVSGRRAVAVDAARRCAAARAHLHAAGRCTAWRQHPDRGTDRRRAVSLCRRRTPCRTRTRARGPRQPGLDRSPDRPHAPGRRTSAVRRANPPRRRPRSARPRATGCCSRTRWRPTRWPAGPARSTRCSTSRGRPSIAQRRSTNCACTVTAMPATSCGPMPGRISSTSTIA